MNQKIIDSKKKKTNFLDPVVWLFNLGVDSGLPKYVSFFGLLQISILFIPESIWIYLGLNATDYLQNFPFFVQHYVSVTTFKNSMFIFWVTSPFTFFINTALLLIHINSKGYSAYLARREARLKKLGKTSDYSFSLGLLIMILLYIWGAGINLNEPAAFGDFIPVQNRFVMMFIHGGAVSLVMPVFLTVAVVNLRANLTIKKI